LPNLLKRHNLALKIVCKTGADARLGQFAGIIKLAPALCPKRENPTREFALHAKPEKVGRLENRRRGTSCFRNHRGFGNQWRYRTQQMGLPDLGRLDQFGSSFCQQLSLGLGA
jgi:hypothetical protein